MKKILSARPQVNSGEVLNESERELSVTDQRLVEYFSLRIKWIGFACSLHFGNAFFLGIIFHFSCVFLICFLLSIHSSTKKNLEFVENHRRQIHMCYFRHICEWISLNPVCPMCKRSVRKIMHNIRGVGANQICEELVLYRLFFSHR